MAIDLQESAKSLYETLKRDRGSLEETWRDCSELTLPYVFPPQDSTKNIKLPTPFNSIGPSGVNSLASKLLLTLLPPTGNFFRLLPKDEVLYEKAANGELIRRSDEEIDKIEEGYSELERDVNTQINIQAIRVPLYEAIKLLIITGNSLIYKIPDKGLKVFSPYQYVVQRDYSGKVITIIIKEKIAKRALPQDIVERVTTKELSRDTSSDDEVEELSIYTRIELISPKKYRVFQEINEVVLEETEKEFTADLLPYRPLRWTSMANEDYGRGLVEQYLGDLRSLEGLTQMIVRGSGILSKIVFGKKPASTTKIEDVQEADTGDFVAGDLEKDISVLSVNKNMDFNIPFQLMDKLEQRLSKAFMLFSSQVRDSERTTAVEVRMVASELEATLGGTHSVLTQDLQLPLIKLILNEVEPKATKLTTPAISTGMAAISRERDFQNLNTMMSAIAQLGPEAIGTYLNIPKYLSKVAISLGIDADDVVKAPEQIQQEQEALRSEEEGAKDMDSNRKLQEIQANKEK